MMKEYIKDGLATLGIEFGSTRIKGVLIGENHEVLATGGYDWENKLVDGVWTYTMSDVWAGLRGCYKNLFDNTFQKFGVEISKISALGISGMMHGYLVFDDFTTVEPLVPFRTWRNTMTQTASADLTALFGFNIPQRWSVAHLYQAILNGEEHISSIKNLTTLAGYVHRMLSGENVLGIGEASGVFPIDSTTCDYDEKMLESFDRKLKEKNIPYSLRNILPKVLCAGESAGTLTDKGAKLLDPTGKLTMGAFMCPPEGDAATGMVATNSIAKRTGNISAGTSVFAMLVLEKSLSKMYKDIDMVTTPNGMPVAMVHCNNCTSDLNAWAELFCQFAQMNGTKISKGKALDFMFEAALSGDGNCGGLLSYNYLSGEHSTGFEQGRPLFVRTPDAEFNFANFSRVHISSAIATLKIGMDILFKNENVKIDNLVGHGGFFKAKNSGQKIMATALNTAVTVMETANEGGAWGVAILAAYMKNALVGETLESYLNEKVFKHFEASEVIPEIKEVESFNQFINKYIDGLAIERTAVDVM